MPRGKKSDGLTVTERAPAMSPEAQENQMIALAIDLAKKQLEEGTASSQTINHYLKLGTMKEKLNIEKLKMEKELMAAKIDVYRSAKDVQEMYEQAMAAFKTYRGEDENEYYD